MGGGTPSGGGSGRALLGGPLKVLGGPLKVLGGPLKVLGGPLMSGVLAPVPLGFGPGTVLGPSTGIGGHPKRLKREKLIICTLLNISGNRLQTARK